MTTLVEYEVGQDLCTLLGYRRQPAVGSTVVDTKEPTGWGHITCGGSIANLESMWYA